MRQTLLVLAALIMLWGCGTARRGEDVAGPLLLPSEKGVAGERYFMTYCNKCHPLGESGVGYALNNKPLPGPLIKAQVRLGAGAMPAFSKEFLPDDKLDAIVAYVQVLRRHR